MSVNLIYQRKADESLEDFKDRLSYALSAIPDIISEPDLARVDFLQIAEEEGEDARTITVKFRELKTPVDTGPGEG